MFLCFIALILLAIVKMSWVKVNPDVSVQEMSLVSKPNSMSVVWTVLSYFQFAIWRIHIHTTVQDSCFPIFSPYAKLSYRL